jgi:hypothetical protein
MFDGRSSSDRATRTDAFESMHRSASSLLALVTVLRASHGSISTSFARSDSYWVCCRYQVCSAARTRISLTAIRLSRVRMLKTASAMSSGGSALIDSHPAPRQSVETDDHCFHRMRDALSNSAVTVFQFRVVPPTDSAFSSAALESLVRPYPSGQYR